MLKKILIIDDDPSSVDILKKRFEQEGYEVIFAYNGRVGLELTEQHRPDLVVLDVMMLDLNGSAVCGILKSDPKYHKPPVLMFSAKDRRIDRAIGDAVQADAYLVKPFSGQDMLAVIHRLIGPAET